MSRNRTTKTAPSHYPRLPFHAIRTLQLLSSIIVASIMAYFTYHLRREAYPEPWTFIYLFAASLASISALAVTICLHCLTGLNPRFNMSVNGALSVLWAVGFGTLTWYMSGTLGERCSTETWNEEVGVMVCRLYKAVWTFTLVGFTSTLSALFLDIYVRRSQTSRGIYRLPDHNEKPRPLATVGPFTDTTTAERDGYATLDAPRESGIWDDRPRLSIGPYGEQRDGEGLWRYDNGPTAGGMRSSESVDTGYHGVHGQAQFRD